MSDQYFEDRLRKLKAIRALGVDPYGGRLTGVLSTSEIREKALGLDLQPGQTSERPEAVARAAGRVILYRDIGKLIFLTIRDQHGEIQIGISKGAMEGSAGVPPAASETSARRQGSAGVPPAASEMSARGQGSAGVPPAASETSARRHGSAGVPPAASETSARRQGSAGVPPAASEMSARRQGSAGVPPASGKPGESAPLAGPVGWQVAKLLDLGDIIGADGKLGKTRTGELTLWATHLHMLSKALRPPPEKYHGLTDVEARYRRRYVDLFANPDSREVFLKRAKIIAHIRSVLHRRGFIEVETPVLQPIYGGAAARPFTTHHNALDMRLYLRISPELYLKRCLVGGLERVYEFARCFRNEGISPRHNPEFTMLELYQAYGDYHDMMEITEEIIAGAAREVIGSYQIPFGERTIDYTPPWPRRRYGDLLREYAGVGLDDREGVLRKARELGIVARLERAQAAVARGADPAEVNPPGMEQLPHAGSAGVPPAAGSAGVPPAGGHANRPNPDRPGAAGLHDAAHPDRPGAAGLHVDHALLVNALFEELVEHHLINPTFVIDYPAPLCPLTRRHPSDPGLALRFEAYVNGMEMGNAYSELNDPAVQRENFAGAVEGEGDETMRVMDEDFCQALEHGMPPAGGLGIGIDRLCMLLTGSQSIREVLLFPLQRPQSQEACE